MDKWIPLCTQQPVATPIHRRPQRSTNHAPVPSTPHRTVGAGQKAGIHTAHSTYYCYWCSLYKRQTLTTYAVDSPPNPRSYGRTS